MDEREIDELPILVLSIATSGNTGTVCACRDHRGKMDAIFDIPKIVRNVHRDPVVEMRAHDLEAKRDAYM